MRYNFFFLIKIEVEDPTSVLFKQVQGLFPPAIDAVIELQAYPMQNVLYAEYHIETDESEADLKQRAELLIQFAYETCGGQRKAWVELRPPQERLLVSSSQVSMPESLKTAA